MKFKIGDKVRITELDLEQYKITNPSLDKHINPTHISSIMKSSNSDEMFYFVKGSMSRTWYFLQNELELEDRNKSHLPDFL